MLKDRLSDFICDLNHLGESLSAKEDRNISAFTIIFLSDLIDIQTRILEEIDEQPSI